MSSYIQTGNSITVPKGSTIQYIVSLDGYTTQIGTIVADKTKTITVSLNETPEKIFKIVTPQDNAVIEFEVVNSDGIYSYSGEESASYSVE